MTAEPEVAEQAPAQEIAAEPAPRRGFIAPVLAIANAVLAVALLGELGAVFVNVIARTFFDTAFLWTDEVAKLALSTLAFGGGAVAYASGHHTYVRVLLKQFGLRGERLCIAAADLLVLLIAIVTGVSSL